MKKAETKTAGKRREEGKAPAPKKSLLTQCQGLTKRGDPCRFPPPQGKSFCTWHDPSPDAQIAAKLAAAKGALASAPRHLPKDHPAATVRSVDEALTLTEETIQEVRTGTLSANVANSVFYGLSVASKFLELQVLDQLEALETMIGVKLTRREQHEREEAHSGTSEAVGGRAGETASGEGPALALEPL